MQQFVTELEVLEKEFSFKEMIRDIIVFGTNSRKIRPDPGEGHRHQWR